MQRIGSGLYQEQIGSILLIVERLTEGRDIGMWHCIYADEPGTVSYWTKAEAMEAGRKTAQFLTQK